ncbi:hypothetical protein [Methylomonas methanica]|uniref:Dolichol-phosphate mannosyltransferase subunit 3 n=1 Tax=Methylomonas methanica TaxID=421 RepID=A0A177MNL2_METMH|nr:hypothetical protein [Methylomonas methanica]OAI06449.1 hypothetical protein A1332_11585 [Methylomonas methanica]
MNISTLTNAIRALISVFIGLTGLVAYLYELMPGTFMQYRPVLFVAYCLTVSGIVWLYIIGYARCRTFAGTALQHLDAIQEAISSTKKGENEGQNAH